MMKTYSRKKSGENQEVIIELNELCRLCMNKEDELVPIFDNDDPVPLTLRIMACVALEVMKLPIFPLLVARLLFCAARLVLVLSSVVIFSEFPTLLSPLFSTVDFYFVFRLLETIRRLRSI